MPRTKSTAPRKNYGGRKTGVSVPSTDKSRAACRLNPWKSGRYAKTAYAESDRRRGTLEKACPGIAAKFDAYSEAIGAGDLTALEPMHVQAMVENEVIRDDMVDRIRQTGTMIVEAVIGPAGTIMAGVTRLKAHPLLEPLRHIDERLGHTAQDLRLSRKTSSESALSDALAARLARDAMLRGVSKDDMPPPPPPRRRLPGDVPIDTEVVG